MTLVVPHLVSDQLRWRLEGRCAARQCLLNRGMLPVLAAPSPSGDQLLDEAVAMACRAGLVKPHDHVVCVQRIHEDFCVKVRSRRTGAWKDGWVFMQTCTAKPFHQGCMLAPEAPDTMPRNALNGR